MKTEYLQRLQYKKYSMISYIITFIGSALMTIVAEKIFPIPKNNIIFFYLVLVVVFIFSLLLHYTLFVGLLKAKINGIKLGLSKVKGVSYCAKKKEKEESMLCPLDVALNIKINDMHNNRLYREQYINEIEPDPSWKYIWIFSKDLYSEIDHKTNQAESVVINNIKQNKTQYTMFYIYPTNDQDLDSDICKRAEILRKEKITLISFNVQDELLGEITLPLLCGSILFSKEEDDKNILLPHFSEGYLSIRYKKDDKPIYYKMPKCMLDGYYEYFKAIYTNTNNYRENLEQMKISARSIKK